MANDVLAVNEAALRLGVDPRRVRAMIRAGILEAEKVAGIWLVDPAGVNRRLNSDVRVGRALSPSNAWATIALAAGDRGEPSPLLEGMSPSARSRVRSRLRVAGLLALAPRLGRRATTHRYRGHPGDLARIAVDPGVVRAGVSAAGEYGADIDAPGVVEAYVRASSVADLVRKYHLEHSAQPNVILRVVRGAWPFTAEDRVAPAAVVALDLMESDDQRSRRAGIQLLQRLEAT